MLDPDLGYYLEGSERKTAILDSNLLVLWISTNLNSDLNQFKRVKSFTEKDARLLRFIVSQFKGVVTTSYVLAEVSNLANSLSGPLRTAWFSELARFAVITDEAHVGTQSLLSNEVIRFGVTDAALSNLSMNYTLITAEYRLSGYLADSVRRVINFNHLSLQLKMNS
jgi:hypothetical protein